MKKLFTTLLGTLFLVSFSGTVEAMSFNPASGAFPVNANQTIQVLNNPSNPASAVKVRLTIDNAKIVSLTDGSGSLLTIGVCDSENAKFRSISTTKYEVCVDIASTSGNIADNHVLMTLTLGSIDASGGTFTITGESDNGYQTTEGEENKSGVLGTYSFSTGSSGSNTTVLPNTAISDYMPTKGILGAAILISGIISLTIAVKIFLLDKRKELF